MLTLQRAIGNEAVRRLLQRDRNDRAMLSKVAKDLGAAAMINDIAATGTDEADIGFARQIRNGQKDGITPGLNIVANLGARGRTGFVAADGTYLGDKLPAATTDLPRIAISIGKQAFDEGETTVRGTLRHEVEHALHDQLMLAVQRNWRKSLASRHRPLPTSERDAQQQFYAFAATEHAAPAGGRLTPAQLELIRGGTEGRFAGTELLAHLAGFMQVFDAAPPAAAAAISSGLMPPAIEQLRGAATYGWPGAGDKVRAEALSGLTAYCRSLSSDQQRLLRDWLAYLRSHAVPPARQGDGEDGRAAAVIADAFGGHTDFLDWMLQALPVRAPTPATRRR